MTASIQKISLLGYLTVMSNERFRVANDQKDIEQYAVWRLSNVRELRKLG